MIDEFTVKTTLKYSGAYTFSSQESSTFTFRVRDGFGDYIACNPLDYVKQFSPVRGNRKETVGGSAIIQQFPTTGTPAKVAFDCDQTISFSAMLTQAEIEDLATAFRYSGYFILSDYLGHSYHVTLDNQEGFVWDNKIKANDRFLVRFKFWVYKVVS